MPYLAATVLAVLDILVQALGSAGLVNNRRQSQRNLPHFDPDFALRQDLVKDQVHSEMAAVVKTKLIKLDQVLALELGLAVGLHLALAPVKDHLDPIHHRDLRLIANEEEAGGRFPTNWTRATTAIR